MAAIDLINQYFETWVSPEYRNNPTSYADVPPPRELLTNLRVRAAALRQHPSYANYATAAVAMAYERLVLKLALQVPLARPDVERGFASYAQFFRDAADVNVTRDGTKSLGALWVQAKQAQATLEAEVASFNGKYLCADTVERCCETGSGSGWWMTGFIVTRYSGDLTTGFQPSGKEIIYTGGPGGNANGCKPSDHPIYDRSTLPVCNIAQQESRDLLGKHEVMFCNAASINTRATAIRDMRTELESMLDGVLQLGVRAEKWAAIKSTAMRDPRREPAVDQAALTRLSAEPSK